MLVDADVQRELGLAQSFGVTALAVIVMVRERVNSAIEAEIARRRGSNLARFFSPTVVEHLADGDDLRLERRNIAVMFVDLRGLTNFAESVSPEQLHHILSEFRDIVSSIVVKHGGAVDNVISQTRLRRPRVGGENVQYVA